jgi:hypothetical protein
MLVDVNKRRNKIKFSSRRQKEKEKTLSNQFIEMNRRRGKEKCKIVGRIKLKERGKRTPNSQLNKHRKKERD